MPADLKKWSRPLWVVIVNLTQFDISYEDSLLWGAFHGETPSCNPWDTSTFGLRNKQTFLGIGWRLGGALTFSVLLDGGHKYEFSVVSDEDENRRLGPFPAHRLTNPTSLMHLGV
ncbi:hypothetical protein PG997_015374 [Apiospora hydei]|uniref:Uncharacterized protein n=1 Tax=Apiospora hydei TaxID=1337664 RepID=A0ABR1UQF2_9PEZI